MATQTMLDRVSADRGRGRKSRTPPKLRVGSAREHGESHVAGSGAMVEAQAAGGGDWHMRLFLGQRRPLSREDMCRQALDAQKRALPCSEWTPCALGGRGRCCGHPCTHKLEHLPLEVHGPVREAYARRVYGKEWTDLSPVAQEKLQGKYLCPASSSCLECLDGLLADAGFGRSDADDADDDLGQATTKAARPARRRRHRCVCALCVAWRGEQAEAAHARVAKDEDFTAILLRRAFLEAHVGQQRSLERVRRRRA